MYFIDYSGCIAPSKKYTNKQLGELKKNYAFRKTFFDLIIAIEANPIPSALDNSANEVLYAIQKWESTKK